MTPRTPPACSTSTTSVPRCSRAPLPFADGEFDDVVASLVLHYLEDRAGPLAELRRVLKPFDIAAVDEPAPSPDTPEELLTPRIRRGHTTSFLSFIFFVLEARGR